MDVDQKNQEECKFYYKNTMGRYIGPKCKQCRRLGESVCGTVKCAVKRRNFAPGMHGNTRRARLSGYGIQLREKQKAKSIYGIREKQFRNYYEKAKAKEGKTGEMILLALETRLDNVIYRSSFASTRRQARQLVSHAQFLVNGRSVNIPSYQVKVGDVITVKESKAKSPFWSAFLQDKENALMTPWLDVDKSKLHITVVSLPTQEHIQSDLQMNLIIELYSL